MLDPRFVLLHVSACMLPNFIPGHALPRQGKGWAILFWYLVQCGQEMITGDKKLFVWRKRRRYRGGLSTNDTSFSLSERLIRYRDKPFCLASSFGEHPSLQWTRLGRCCIDNMLILLHSPCTAHIMLPRCRKVEITGLKYGYFHTALRTQFQHSSTYILCWIDCIQTCT